MFWSSLPLTSFSLVPPFPPLSLSPLNFVCSHLVVLKLPSPLSSDCMCRGVGTSRVEVASQGRHLWSKSTQFPARYGTSWTTSPSTLWFYLASSCPDLVYAVRAALSSYVQWRYHVWEICFVLLCLAGFYSCLFLKSFLSPFTMISESYEDGCGTDVSFRVESSTASYSPHTDLT